MRSPSNKEQARAGAPGTEQPSGNPFVVSPPPVSLPKGGGAIRGLGEKFGVNPATGSGSLTVPLPASPGRSGFGPQLQLSYDSAAGNGPFGFGWHLSLPAITRKTDKGLPRYDESDVFVLSAAEDLVPELAGDGSELPDLDEAERPFDPQSSTWRVRRYRPRIEGSFARIERWTSRSGEVHWRTISADNVRTVYGADAASRIADPADPRRAFSWLACEILDDKGNAVELAYKAEDGAGVDLGAAHERHRGPASDPGRTAHRYLKRVRHGNRTSALDPVTHRRPRFLADRRLPPGDWMFELVLDYGEHDDLSPEGSVPWRCRPDPFSTYRAGFEDRTYRLCRRVLAFHHFPGDPEVGADCLVRALELSYRTAPVHAESSDPGYSFVERIQLWSHRRDGTGGYRAPLPMPPLDCTYSEARIDARIREVDPESVANLPAGLSADTQWVDLDGEGIAGALAEQGGAWHYKPGLGEARLGPLHAVAQLPAGAALAGGRQQLLDVQGNGALDIVDLHPPLAGFYERDGEGWKPFSPFAQVPLVDWRDPNLRFADLTGDGHADVLVTEEEAITWYPSLAGEGFGAAVRVPTGPDETEGSRLVFADGEQSVHLADLSGDGLPDLVRIRNGQVCYWPNLGYGRFGKRVEMDRAPRFDLPERFDPARVRLADVDGSGTTDLLYLGAGEVRIWLNRSGNGWSEPHVVALPSAAEHAAIQVADLLGNGTACLVWSSGLPADAGRPLRYLDLMGGLKPHLLVGVKNNLGAETEVEYAPSTRFYLADKAAGAPWVTRLPFPVHCVARVTALDRWRKTHFSQRYSYHHGHFDGVEREFRGFGRVEQVDCESVEGFLAANAGSPSVAADRALHQPPVKTITWHHTGHAEERERILGAYQHEYFPARFADRLAGASFAERELAEPEVDPGEGPALTPAEWREALRACKGMALRQEVYELDQVRLAQGEEVPVRLFSAAQHNCHVRRLQPRGGNPHAVFHAVESEALTYHYELSLAGGRLEPDPRVAHALNLRIDRYGRVEQAVAAVYPRWGRFEAPWAGEVKPAGAFDRIRAVQAEQHLAYTETHFTGELTSPGDHRLPAPCEVLAYELTGVDPADPGDRSSPDPVDDRYFTLDELRRYRLSETLPGQGPEPVASLAYHEQADPPPRPGQPPRRPQKRLVEHAVTLFFREDLSGPEPFGTPSRLGLTCEGYKLALTEPLLAAVLREKLDAEARAALSEPGGSPGFLASGYQTGSAVRGNGGAGEWWMRSGVAGFADAAADRFYLPDRYRDLFGQETRLFYDPDLLYVAESADARGNVTAVLSFDHRTLAPTRLRNPNGNLSAVAFDGRGLPVATAHMGKLGAAGPESGDTLDGFDPALLDPAPAAVARFFGELPLDRAQARRWLGTATARFVYHLGEASGAGGLVTWGATPAATCSILREKHEGELPNVDDAPPDQQLPVQIAFEYSGGAGQVLVKKAQAEPHPTDPLTRVRWIASGKTVLNNKGKPVLQYEPYFSADAAGAPDHRFEEPAAVGVTPVLTYDAPGRLVRTDSPDGTFELVAFSPWEVWHFDAADTVLQSRWYAEVPSPPPDQELPADAAPEVRARWLSAQHAGTPSLAVLDSLGREVISVAHNRAPAGVGPRREERYLTHTVLDAEGKPLWIRDARGNLVMQYVRREPPPAPPRGGEPLRINQVEPEVFTPASDVAGNLLFQHSMDAGDRWTIADAAGRAMLAWDENEVRSAGGARVLERRRFRTRYDPLHRPLELWLQVEGRAPALVECFEYADASSFDGDPAGLAAAQGRNLLGQAVRHWDPSGLAALERVDLEGQPAEVARTLVADPTAPVVDWSGDRGALLEGETYRQLTERDALGRTSRLYSWHHGGEGARVAVYEPRYDERGALASEQIHVRARKTVAPDGKVGFERDPARSATAIVRVTRNARGQTESLALGNGTVTRYRYDERTFQLLGLYTARPGDPAGPPASGLGGLQNLRYTYDAAGNVVRIGDQAQDAAWFRNHRVDATGEYVHDALYRLVEATGRESDTPQVGPPEAWEGPWTRGGVPTDQMLRAYAQSYAYDEVGNILELRHRAAGGSWTRSYAVRPDSNRLDRTWYGGATGDGVTYRHDPHGNMLNLAATAPASDLRWDWRDMIQSLDLAGGGWAFYAYGSDKQRTRKQLRRDSGEVKDRIYLPGYERYRRRNPAGEVVEEIESLHLFEGEERVLLVDDVLQAAPAGSGWPGDLPVVEQTLFRYQYGNHLGSVGAELDREARLVSWEEFHPYGTSAYRLMNDAIEAPPRRYRYTGMERDEESGLGYHGARNYACRLGRWASTDPAGVGDGPNLYVYAHLTPAGLSDRTGRQADAPAHDSEYYRRTADFFRGEGWIEEEREYRELQHKAAVQEGIARARAMTRQTQRESTLLLGIATAAPAVIAVGFEGLALAAAAYESALLSQVGIRVGMAIMRSRLIHGALSLALGYISDDPSSGGIELPGPIGLAAEAARGGRSAAGTVASAFGAAVARSRLPKPRVIRRLTDATKRVLQRAHEAGRHILRITAADQSHNIIADFWVISGSGGKEGHTEFVGVVEELAERHILPKAKSILMQGVLNPCTTRNGAAQSCHDVLRALAQHGAEILYSTQALRLDFGLATKRVDWFYDAGLGYLRSTSETYSQAPHVVVDMVKGLMKKATGSNVHQQ